MQNRISCFNMQEIAKVLAYRAIIAHKEGINGGKTEKIAVIIAARRENSCIQIINRVQNLLINQKIAYE